MATKTSSPARSGTAKKQSASGSSTSNRTSKKPQSRTKTSSTKTTQPAARKSNVNSTKNTKNSPAKKDMLERKKSRIESNTSLLEELGNFHDDDKLYKEAVRAVNEQINTEDVVHEVAMILIFSFSVLLFLSNFELCGDFGAVFKDVMFGMFGVVAYILPVVLFSLVAFYLTDKKKKVNYNAKLLGCIVLLILFASIIQMAQGGMEWNTSIVDMYKKSSAEKNGGGVIGGYLSMVLQRAFGNIGGYIILVTVTLVVGILTTGKAVFKLTRKLVEGIVAVFKAANEQNDEQQADYGFAESADKQRQGSKAQSFLLKNTPNLPQEYEIKAKTEKTLIEEKTAKKTEEKTEYKSEEKTDIETAEKVEEEKEDYFDRQNFTETVLQEEKKKSDTLPEDEIEVTGMVYDDSDFMDDFSKAARKVEQTVPYATANSAEAIWKKLENEEVRKKYVKYNVPYTENTSQSVKAFSETVSQPVNSFSETALADMRNREAASKVSPVFTQVPYSSVTTPAAGKSVSISDVNTVSQVITPNYDAIEQPDNYTGPQQQSQSQPASQVQKDVWTDTEQAVRTTVRRVNVQPDNTEELKIDINQPVIKEYEFPPMSLLARPSSDGKLGNMSEKRATAQKLKDTLKSFGVNVTVTNVSCGPAVTRYELQPEQGVKVSRITALSDDIKLNLAAADIRIEAPIPGKAAVGIEVPNKDNTTVFLRELLDSTEFRQKSSKLAFAVGKDISGQIVVTDIAKMPHMLIAGATGSGKSVCINTLIMSILYKAKPDEVKMIMVDPKMVELSVYNGIPHLLIPVVTDPKKASAALGWAVAEMTERYNKFAQLGVRDLAGYNERIEEAAKEGLADENYTKMPQIVIIVDELADLMMVAPGEVEESICRLAQMARAAGLHLVIATQRPSVNVITGLIKANVPSRIAFAVSSAVDSRTIIDGSGAEKLLGKGDMLFFPSGFPKPVRVQGAFVSDKEVSAVVSFLKENAMEDMTSYSREVADKITTVQNSQASSDSDRDEYFVEAGRFIIEKDKASISLLQRVYNIGFNRAARLMDQLCEAGVVGPEEGTKPRRILMTIDEFNQYIGE